MHGICNLLSVSFPNIFGLDSLFSCHFLFILFCFPLIPQCDSGSLFLNPSNPMSDQSLLLVVRRILRVFSSSPSLPCSMVVSQLPNALKRFQALSFTRCAHPLLVLLCSLCVTGRSSRQSPQLSWSQGICQV